MNYVLNELINNGIVSNQISQPLAQYTLDQQSSLQTNPPAFQSNGNFQNNFSNQVNNLPANHNQMGDFINNDPSNFKTMIDHGQPSMLIDEDNNYDLNESFQFLNASFLVDETSL